MSHEKEIIDKNDNCPDCGEQIRMVAGKTVCINPDCTPDMYENSYQEYLDIYDQVPFDLLLDAESEPDDENSFTFNSRESR